MDRKARVLENVRQRRARRSESKSLGALDDGGEWARCTSCDTYKRLGSSPAPGHIAYCAECGEGTEHVNDVPSYAGE